MPNWWDYASPSQPSPRPEASPYQGPSSNPHPYTLLGPPPGGAQELMDGYGPQGPQGLQSQAPPPVPNIDQILAGLQSMYGQGTMPPGGTYPPPPPPPPAAPPPSAPGQPNSMNGGGLQSGPGPFQDPAAMVRPPGWTSRWDRQQNRYQEQQNPLWQQLLAQYGINFMRPGMMQGR